MLTNQISVEQRFAKRDKKEYHVFSLEVDDAKTVEKWVGLTQPRNVLMDPATYARLRNNRIEWVFDDEGTLSGVEIKDEQRQ